MTDAAIEAAARALADADGGPAFDDTPQDERLEFLKQARAAIAAYEAASNPQHARAISILRRIVTGYRPAHGSMEAWDEALALLREVDGEKVANTR